MKVDWIRHGQTVQNVAQTYYGTLESELTPKGRTQIAQITQYVNSDLPYYLSPTKRTKETAYLLFGEKQGKEDSRLLERRMGIFEGLTYDEIGERYPQEQKAWAQDWQAYCIPKGESAKQQYERVSHFVKELEKKGEDCVVVAHAGTIRMALVYLLGGDLDHFWRFRIDTGTLVRTRYEGAYWHMNLSQRLDEGENI